MSGIVFHYRGRSIFDHTVDFDTGQSMFLAICQYLLKSLVHRLSRKYGLLAPIRSALASPGSIDIGQIAGDQIHAKSLGTQAA
jgi:hypothetical protein